MKKMELAIRPESDLQKWEECLRDFSATPFFAPAWLECFRNENRIPIYLRFVSNGKTVGLAAGLRNEPSMACMKKLFRILFFYSGPAVIGADAELAKRCLEKLIGYAADNKYTHIKLESWDCPCALDVDTLPVTPTIRKEYILDMRASLTELIRKIKKNRRTDVRAAERNGLTFHEVGSPEILNDLLNLQKETKSIRLSKNYGDYASLYISYLNKETLYTLFKNGIARAFCVKRKEEILSVSLEAVYHKRAYGLFAGTNQLGYKLKSNALLNFKIIEKLKSEGIEFYNFGGVPSDASAQGLSFFKASFGARDQVCVGGRTCHLRSPLINHLAAIYHKFPETRLKKMLRRRLTGRNYA